MTPSDLLRTDEELDRARAICAQEMSKTDADGYVYTRLRVAAMMKGEYDDTIQMRIAVAALRTSDEGKVKTDATKTMGAQLRPRDELLGMIDNLVSVAIASGGGDGVQLLSALSEAAERIRADGQALAGRER